MSEERAPCNVSDAPRNLALVRDALGQGGIDEGLKLARGLRIGSIQVPAGQGDAWLENSIRYSTALSAGAQGGTVPIGAGAGWQLIAMDTELWDTDEIFDLAASVTRMVIKTGGIYQVHGQVNWATNAAGYRGAGLQLNGATLIAQTFHNALGIPTNLTTSATWMLSNGDYIELVGYHSFAGIINVTTPLLTVTRIP